MEPMEMFLNRDTLRGSAVLQQRDVQLCVPEDVGEEIAAVALFVDIPRLLRVCGVGEVLHFGGPPVEASAGRDIQVFVGSNAGNAW